MSNLHITYDLKQPGRDYPAVIEKIKQLGSWAKITESFWYVKSTYTPKDAVDYIWPSMDETDSIYIVDSTDNTAAWRNINLKVSEHLKAKWYP